MLTDFWRDITEQGGTLAQHAPHLTECCRWVRERGFHPERIILTGLATSLYAWETVRPQLEATAPGVSIIETGELFHYYRPLLEKAEAVFVISRSGASAEVVRLLEYLRPGQALAAITEERDSPLARRAAAVFPIDARERCFVNTKSFTLSLAYAGAVAAGIANQPAVLLETALTEAACQIDTFIQKGGPAASDIAGRLGSARALLVMMRGALTGIGLQLCLDFQEGLRMAAVPVPGSLLRHGTIELTTQRDVASLFFAHDDPAGRLFMKAAREVAQWNQAVAVIGPALRDCVPAPFPILETESGAAPIVYAVAGQLVYYHLALQKGIREIEPKLVGKVTRTE